MRTTIKDSMVVEQTIIRNNLMGLVVFFIIDDTFRDEVFRLQLK